MKKSNKAEITEILNERKSLQIDAYRLNNIMQKKLDSNMKI